MTTVHQPLGIENNNCTRNIQAEMYHAQVTLAQGPFSIRAVCTGWGIEFIAANLYTPTTVMHYPTQKQVIKELKKSYDYFGISFSNCTFPKAIELCQLARQYAPKTKFVLGGYGTVLPECDQYGDYICREEGVNFFKQLLGEPPVESYKIPLIKRFMKVLSFAIGPEIILPTGLGCSRGCDFCCTSHFFKNDYIPLIPSGKEIHDFIWSADFGKSSYRDIGIIDEDFLLDYQRALELAKWNAIEIDRPILFSCLTSLKSLSQYRINELLSMGLAGVWVGIESQKTSYSKLKDINVKEAISTYKKAGISVLTSMILGYDWHDADEIEKDFEYLLALKPTLSQFMLYSPCPGTPLHKKLSAENRLIDISYHQHDGFHMMFKHPHFSKNELEKILLRLFQREYEELGPCIFRYLEIQLNGYEALKNKRNPLFRRRALAHQRFCLRLYPLLRIGISNAPSHKVKEYLQSLREHIEESFKIPLTEKSKQVVVPLLYYYTKIKDTFFPHQQPPSEIHYYHYLN